MKNKGDQINQVGLFSQKTFFCQIDLFAYPTTYGVIVKPLYSGHPWDVANWLLHKGGLIIQCTFNREVLFGTLIGGCFREVTFLYRFAIWLL